MKEMTSPYFLVIGLGASGVSAAKFLCARGKSVVATDIDPARASLAKELNALGIKTEIGFHDPNTFNRAGTLIPSPGIPLTLPHIQEALAHGADLTGELDLFAAYNTLPVIAITGTNGKTTTTTLIGDMLRACGRNPFVGGNIGTPLLENLMAPGNTDVVVAEISSFQLDISKTFRPQVGVLLNISEDHLDRYPSYEAYEESKWSLFKNQVPSDTAVVNRAVRGFEKACKNIRARVLDFSSEPASRAGCAAEIRDQDIRIRFEGRTHILGTDHLKELQGAHNRENMAAAVLACLALGNFPMENLAAGLESFKNLSHRMEWVKTIQGVSFYDDSKATNTDAVVRALECFKKDIILILGGREKGTDFSLLLSHVKKSVKAIVSIGESRGHVMETFQGLCPVMEARTMQEAVEKGYALALPGDVVLLSPACASFDMFDNYAHRGREFAARVHGLGGQHHD
nr:UDP-N-acetylmuramoyl-L-alanine--D-glutamate ligase [Desulfobacula sp.]